MHAQDLQDDLLLRVRVTTTVEHQLLRLLASYILELSLLDRVLLAYAAPLQAASSVLLARVLLASLRNSDTRRTRRVTVWPDELQKHSGFVAADLDSCTTQQLQLLHGAPENDDVEVIYQKYSRPACMRVAQLPFLECMPVQAFEDGQQFEFPVKELGILPVVDLDLTPLDRLCLLN